MPKKMPAGRRVAVAKPKGKSPSAEAGDFVREEIHHVRDHEHGARSAKQVIAIALSKARRAGVDLPPPKNASVEVRKQAARDTESAHDHHKVSPARSRAAHEALEREGYAAASHTALSRHAHAVARQESRTETPRSEKKAPAKRSG